MPYLFCETHGREHEAGAAGREEAYRKEGETVLTMRGTLISGPWQCDRGTCGIRSARACEPTWPRLPRLDR